MQVPLRGLVAIAGPEMKPGRGVNENRPSWRPNRQTPDSAPDGGCATCGLAGGLDMPSDFHGTPTCGREPRRGIGSASIRHLSS